MRALWTLAALALAAPAAAQERMSREQCEDTLVQLAALVGTETPQVEVTSDAEGWCVVADARLNLDQYSQWSLDKLRWRAGDIARFLDEGLPPRSLEIIGEGLGVLAETGDPVFDYLFEIQASQSKSEFGLNIRWDGLQNAVVVEEAYITFNADNRISASARIDGVNLTDAASMQTSLGSFGLRDLSAQAEFDGWFEAYLAMPLGQLVLQNGDVAPQTQVEALQDQAVTFIQALPNESVPENTRAALSAFVEALPNPRGSARLQLSATPPIGMARFAPLGLTAQAPTLDTFVPILLEGTSLLFTWAPTGEAR